MMTWRIARLEERDRKKNLKETPSYKNKQKGSLKFETQTLPFYITSIPSSSGPSSTSAFFSYFWDNGHGWVTLFLSLGALNLDFIAGRLRMYHAGVEALRQVQTADTILLGRAKGRSASPSHGKPCVILYTTKIVYQAGTEDLWSMIMIMKYISRSLTANE